MRPGRDDERTIQWRLFAILVVSVPCFVFMLLCGGFLPVGVMVLALLRALWLGNLFLATLLLPHIALYALLLHWVARRVARYAARTGRGSAILLVASVLAVIPLLVPLYWFDCMDGRHQTTCSGVRMYVGWLQSGLAGWVDDSCGDLGW